MTTDTTAIPQGARGAANPAVTASLLILLVATATIAGAWFFQLVLDIQPCPLCLEQRYAYYALIPLSALVAIGAARRAPRGLLLLGLVLLALAALANAALGTYHAGVEWGFWKGPTDCTGPVGNLGSAGSLLRASGHGQGGALRRSAVALSRHLARRLQRADLAVDGRDRGLGIDRGVQA